MNNDDIRQPLDDALGDETTRAGKARENLERARGYLGGSAKRATMALPLLIKVFEHLLDVQAEQKLRPALDAGASRQDDSTGSAFDARSVGFSPTPSAVNPDDPDAEMPIMVEIDGVFGTEWVSRELWKTSTPESWADGPTPEPANPWPDMYRDVAKRLGVTWSEPVPQDSRDSVLELVSDFRATRSDEPDAWPAINAEFVRLMILRDNGTATAGDNASLGGLQAYALERQRAIMGIPADPEPSDSPAEPKTCGCPELLAAQDTIDGLEFNLAAERSGALAQRTRFDRLAIDHERLKAECEAPAESSRAMRDALIDMSGSMAGDRDTTEHIIRYARVHAGDQNDHIHARTSQRDHAWAIVRDLVGIEAPKASEPNMMSMAELEEKRAAMAGKLANADAVADERARAWLHLSKLSGAEDGDVDIDGMAKLIENKLDALGTLKAEHGHTLRSLKRATDKSAERQDLLRETAESLRSYLPGHDI